MHLHLKVHHLQHVLLLLCMIGRMMGRALSLLNPVAIMAWQPSLHADETMHAGSQASGFLKAACTTQKVY